MSAKQTKKKNTPSPKTVNLSFKLPPDLVGQFTDNLVVSHTEGEFILSFTQTIHPLITKPEDAAKINSIEARCIARLIITPSKMKEMIEVLVGNFETFTKAKQIRDSKDGNSL